MGKRSNITRILFFLLLLLSACKPEADFEGWLTRKAGSWNIYAASSRTVTYTTTMDSTISGASNMENIGSMHFFDPLQCEFDFSLEGIMWNGQYNYTADENGFVIQKLSRDSFFVGDNRLTVTGYNNSRKTMHVDLRYDLVPNRAGFVVIRAGMELQRK